MFFLEEVATGGSASPGKIIVFLIKVLFLNDNILDFADSVSLMQAVREHSPGRPVDSAPGTTQHFFIFFHCLM